MTRACSPTLEGYARPGGAIGFRNLVVVSSLSDLTNDVAFRIARGAAGAVAVLSARGGLSFGAEEELDATLQRRLATNPNVGAILALAPTRPELDSFVDSLATACRPIETLCAYGDKDTDRAVARGIACVRALQAELSTTRLGPVDAKSLRVGLRSSSTTAQSAATVHAAVGKAVTALIEYGAAIAFTELADLAAKVDELASRAPSADLAAAIREALVETRDTLKGLGVSAPDPTPLNRLGGIATLAQKGDAALRRLGEGPIRSIVRYGSPFEGPGLHVIRGPGSAALSLTGFAAAHCNMLLYTVGGTSWAPNSPLCPVVMVGGAALNGSPDLDVVATGSPRDSQQIIEALIRVATGGSSAVERRAGEFIALPHSLAAL